MVKSKKYTGVYHRPLLGGKDRTYYITYKLNGKTHKVCLGKESENITEHFCHQQRNIIINKAKYGDEAPINKYKRKDKVAFKDAVQQYIQSKELAKKTIMVYKSVSSIFGDKLLSDIDTEMINKLKNSLKDAHKAPKTINNIIAKIGTIFNYAIDTEIFKGANPCKKVDKIKHDNKRERYLTIDEIATLKNAFKDKPLVLLFIELSLSTGGRLGTIMAIQKKDINLIRRTISLQNIKSKNNFTGFISDSLYPLLEKRLKELHKPNDNILSVSQRVIENNLQPALNRLFNENLDPKDTKQRVVIHTLRHTFASHLAINGVPIFTIMKLLDHKDIKDTLRYAKLAPDNGLDAVRGLW